MSQLLLLLLTKDNNIDQYVSFIIYDYIKCTFYNIIIIYVWMIWERDQFEIVFTIDG